MERLGSSHMEEMYAAGFLFSGPSLPTIVSHVQFSALGNVKKQLGSIIDHACDSGISTPQVVVDDFAATDHHPV